MPASGNVVLNNNSNDRQEILSVHWSCWSLSKLLLLIVWLENFNAHICLNRVYFVQGKQCISHKKISVSCTIYSHIVITGLWGPVWNTNECASVIRMKGQKWRKSGTSQPHFTELDNYIFPLLIFPLHYKHLGKKKWIRCVGRGVTSETFFFSSINWKSEDL